MTRTRSYWGPFFMATDLDIPDKFSVAIRVILWVVFAFIFALVGWEKFWDGQLFATAVNAVLLVVTTVIAVKWEKIAALLARWREKMALVLLALGFGGALALGIAIGGLLLRGGAPTTPTTPSGRITWNFDQAASGHGFFLNLNRLNNEEIRVAGFQAHGKNTSGDPVTQFSGYIRSDLTNASMPIYLLAQENSDVPTPRFPFPVVVKIPTLPDQTYGIPGFADFDISTFDKAIFEQGKDGVLLSKFLKDFGTFTLVLEYDGLKIERHFSNDEIAKQLALFENSTNLQNNTNPRVLRKPDAAPPIMPSAPPLPLPMPANPPPKG
jgi:hypothetical protein